MASPTVDPGLCGRCTWARTVTSSRQATFLRCARSDTDSRFAKYPSLPVLECDGFETRDEPPARTSSALPLAERAAAASPAAALRAPALSLVGVDALGAGGGPPLLERVGGREGVARIVEAFYARIETDAELRALFPEDMSGGREKQKLFLEQWLGGEARYSRRYGDPRLRRRHFPFVISDRAAGRWLRHMAGALTECGIDEATRVALLGALGPLARHMVNEGEDVPREPLPEGAFLD